MPSGYLASVLVDAVRETGQLPRSDESSTTSKIIGIMNREQRLYLTSLLLRAREEYHVATVTVTVTAGTSAYAIPSRAVAAGLKSVELVVAGGNRILNPIAPETATTYGSAGTGDYYLQGNSLVLLNSGASGSLLVKYFRRLNKIVPAAETAEIASINTTTKAVTLVSRPSTMTGSATYDFIKGTPHFDVLDIDLAATQVGLVLTFAVALPASLAVGDYVALAGETPICNAALELQDVLVMRAVFKYLRGNKDPAAAEAKADADEAEKDALSIICPRVETDTKPIQNFNAPGWNRYRRRRFVVT